MTPLEAMAKAYWENRGNQPWDGLTIAFKKQEMDDIRAAVLALAECDFYVPDQVVPSVEEVDGEVRAAELTVAPFTSICVFRNLLRSIAEGD